MIRSLGTVGLLALIACVRPQQFGSGAAARRGVAGGDATMYVLERTEAPWADYGDVLVHGMSMHLERAGLSIQLERTGPFVPPVTLPGVGDVIVTDAARHALERAVPGLVFRPVVKTRIVRLDWHTWDRAVEEPAEYPSTGEPEDYILERPHHPELAEQIGPLWEMVPVVIPAIQLKGAFNSAAYDGQDFVRAAPRVGVNFVSARLMKALSAVAAEWITFRPAP